MSENTKPTPQNDELDLGQMFVYVEKVFKKLGHLISRFFRFFMLVLGKLVVFLFLVVNVVKKHFIIIGLAGVLGFAIPLSLEKISKKKYRASMLIKQNYNTGNVLYSNVRRFNDLAMTADSINLSKELDISIEKAVNITEFSVSGFMNKNELLEEYTQYIKNMDSIDKPSYKSYSENVDLSSTSIQNIAVTSLSPDIYDGLSESIITSVNISPFFIKEKEDAIENLKNEIKLTQETIEKSDSLQDKYFKILSKYYSSEENPNNPKQGTVNLNLTNNKDKISTKEFELFQIQLTNRQKLNELQARLSKKQNIIELQKDFESPTLINSDYKDMKLTISVICMLVVLLFFVLKNLNFGKLMKEYGTKEKLFE